jgi:hypothetical protein
MRKLIALVGLLVLTGVGVYVSAGYRGGPTVEIPSPERYVGLATPLEVVIAVPGGRLSSIAIDFEQNGTRSPVFAWTSNASTPLTGEEGVAEEAPGQFRIARSIGRQTVPSLQSGPGRILVSASRPVLNGLRDLETAEVRDVEVRLERPRLSVASTHHYVNQGGAELVVYRATPDDVESGVVVGEIEYPGFPASGVTIEGARIADPAVRVAFFALLHDQPVDTPIRLFARDPAGNAARVDVDRRAFPKAFKSSRIELTDAFIDRVVPAILEGTSDISPQGSIVEKYVAVNSELRRLNAAKIASFAAETSPEMLWRGEVFHPFTNNAVESAFADRRTYFYQGREVDRQVHLGFDLASYAQTPIVAANRGKVLFADELGIYGNCVIIDHGMGLQSLYGHLSSIDVQPGAMVEKDQPIGRSGMTGLAGGDHLHFTMLLNGQMINPVEWWDSHWIQDRILRKVRSGS